MIRRAAPRTPVWLGVAGAAPFVPGAVAIALGPDWLRVTVFYHLTNYAALMLAGLGAALWGFAGAAGARGAWFAAAAAPPVAAWLSLAAVQPTLRVALLAAGFVFSFFADRAAARRGMLPPWYMALRKPLTAVVLAALGAIAAAA